MSSSRPKEYRVYDCFKPKSSSDRTLRLEMPPNLVKSARQLSSYSPSYTLSIIIVMLISLTLGTARVQCYVEKWTLGIAGGIEEAHQVASESGCKNLGPLKGLDDVYLFEKRVSRHAVHRQKRTLESHPLVSWADPQVAYERVKRDYVSIPSMSRGQQAHLQQQQQKVHANKSLPGQLFAMLTGSRNSGASTSGSSSSGSSGSPGSSSANSGLISYTETGSSSVGSSPACALNDELWTHQWYLKDNSNVDQLQGEVELKVEDVWKMGFTGAGVVVTILDDGLEWNHTDILPNYDARASWDMNNNRSDPFPRYDAYNSNSHGTRCAGEVAMAANNRKCGVGVAPRARIGGIKCLDGPVTDEVEGRSLQHNIDYIDIYSSSWGPEDDGKALDGPKRLASQALERGTKYGRQGKGILYVWASGNGGPSGDTCACDGYLSSIYTISIGGVTQQGHFPYYGERCSSTLAVACSSGAQSDRKIVTCDLYNKCTSDFKGTSAAAPLAAGVYALALEANSNLTWRDVQHLTVWTSNPIPMRSSPGWRRNAAGLLFNSRFGYGLLNAKAMVEAALKWQTVPKKSICVVAPSTRMPVFLRSRNVAEAIFVTDGCQREHEKQQKQQQQQQQQQQHKQVSGQSHRKQRTKSRKHSWQHLPQTGPTPVIYLEHVQVIIDLEYTSRGSIDMFLVSPAGTVSTLLTRRPRDNSAEGFDKWPLMSVHFWAETSFGKWALVVRDRDGQNNRGLLRNATLVLHGTTTRPGHMQQARVYADESEVQSILDPVSEFDENDFYDLNSYRGGSMSNSDESDNYESSLSKSMMSIVPSEGERRKH